MDWAYNLDPHAPTDSEATLELVFCIRRPVQRGKGLGDPLGLIWAADWAAAVMYPEILIYCFPWNPTLDELVSDFILENGPTTSKGYIPSWEYSEKSLRNAFKK
jgi:hypothetical protein